MNKLILFLILLLTAGARSHAVEVLLPKGGDSKWAYYDEGVLEGEKWRSSDFDAKEWKSGVAPLGYGDEGMGTEISYGDDTDAKHVTTYFRKAIEWKAGDGEMLEVLFRCDDGGIVYLNGKEIARKNMPAGAVTGKTLAVDAISGDAETAYSRFQLPLEGNLKEGGNLIAVEVHQANPSSSDLQFDLEVNLYKKGEEPKVDHFAEGMAAFQQSEIEEGLRHFSLIPVDDPKFEDALQIQVEQLFSPRGLNRPEKGIEVATKAYEAKPEDLEIVRAYIRSHVLAGKGLTLPLEKRPLPEKTPEEFAFIAIPMTFENVKEEFSPKQVAADLDYLEHMIDNCYSYAERRGVDWKIALDVLRKVVKDRKISSAELAARLERFITLFGDPHTALRVPPFYAPTDRAGFLPLSEGGRVFVIREDRSGFLDSDHRYLKSIDGRPLADWLAAASHRTPKASPQYERQALVAMLRQIKWLRTELQLPESDKVKLTLTNSDESAEVMREVSVDSNGGSDLRGRKTQVLDGNIGYLRIPSMRSDQEHMESLNNWMTQFKDTKGLIIDVRDNGGGSQDTLKTLLPYFMKPDAPLRVVNVAAYRMPVKLPQPNPSGFLGLYGRGLHPVTSEVWKDDEKESIRAFLNTFDAKWKLPEGKFSDWHVMGIRPSTNPKAWHYIKPTVILCNAGCFSATDNFLGGFKGVENVTLIGTASGGGSGRMQSYRLPNAGFSLTICQMASFQRNGYTYDGHGVEPDVEIPARPEDALEGGGDSLLEAALKRLRAE